MKVPKKDGPVVGAVNQKATGGGAAGVPNDTPRDWAAELNQGRADRDQGAQQALDGAHSWSRMAAEAVLRELAASGRPFVADDVRERVGSPLGSSVNTMGALFLNAAREGLIVHRGWRQSTRREAHARALRVWIGAEHEAGAA